MRSIHLFRLPAAIAAVTILSNSLQAAPITTLHSTGVDAAGAPLTGGSIDPHWRLVISPDPDYPGPDLKVLNNNAAPFSNGYISNTLTSKWIGPRADGGHNFPASDCTVGCLTAYYHFETTFDLTGMDPDTVQINGQWAMDDAGEMLLNGASTGVTRPFVPQVNWKTWAPFTLSSGFLPGLNTLTVVVQNYYFPHAGLSNNAVGLQVQLTGTANVPEPAALLLLVVGVTALPRARRCA